MKRQAFRMRNFIHYVRAFGLPAAAALSLRRFNRDGIMTIRIKGLRAPILLRTVGSDFVTLEQTIGRRENIIELDFEPGVIVDGGANVGLSAVVFANRFPRAAILAIEPDADNFRMLRENCRAYPKTTPINAALWHTRGLLVIDNPGDESWSFRVRQQESSTDGSVPAITLADLLARIGGTIDLLKLDIEGAEYELLANDPQRWLAHVRVLMIELHERLRPGVEKLFQEVISKRAHRLWRQGEYVIVEFDAAPAASVSSVD